VDQDWTGDFQQFCGSELDRTGDFQQFCRSGLDRIQFCQIRTGLGLKNFTVCSSLFPAREYENESGLDRTGSGLKTILAGSGLDRTAIFFKNGGQDWIGLRKFCCFYVIILKISKILVVIRFHGLLNGSVYFAIELFCKSNCIHLCSHVTLSSTSNVNIVEWLVSMPAVRSVLPTLQFSRKFRLVFSWSCGFF